jgi:hypothetical protein
MANPRYNQQLDEAMIYALEPEDQLMVEDIGLAPGFSEALIPEEGDPWAEDMIPAEDYIPPGEGEFYANLAETIPEGPREFLAQTVIKWVAEDKNGRKDWAMREAAKGDTK